MDMALHTSSFHACLYASLGPATVRRPAREARAKKRPARGGPNLDCTCSNEPTPRFSRRSALSGAKNSSDHDCYLRLLKPHELRDLPDHRFRLRRRLRWRGVRRRGTARCHGLQGQCDPDRRLVVPLPPRPGDPEQFSRAQRTRRKGALEGRGLGRRNGRGRQAEAALAEQAVGRGPPRKIEMIHVSHFDYMSTRAEAPERGKAQTTWPLPALTREQPLVLGV